MSRKSQNIMLRIESTFWDYNNQHVTASPKWNGIKTILQWQKQTFVAHKHAVVISIRTLKRLCRNLQLLRRINHTSLEEVQAAIAANWQMRGYGWLHLHALRREDVAIRHLIKFFDPEGAELRRAQFPTVFSIHTLYFQFFFSTLHTDFILEI